MNLISGISGSAATVLIIALIFTEETGVPLPFAPGDLVIVAGGFLISTGAINPFLLLPGVLIGATGGMLIGFSWSRLLGIGGLRKLAEKVHAEKLLDRVARQIAGASPVRIAIGRLLPGFRIYTTLIAGATRVPLARFLAGAIPATIIWILFFTGIGAVVGIPATHLLTRLDKFATDATVLLLLSVAAFLAIRHIPATVRGSHALTWIPTPWRLLLAAALDLAMVISSEEICGLGIHALVGNNTHFGSFIDLAAGLLTLIVYVAITRISSGATVGELLLNTSYRSHRRYVPQEPADPAA